MIEPRLRSSCAATCQLTSSNTLCEPFRSTRPVFTNSVSTTSSGLKAVNQTYPNPQDSPESFDNLKHDNPLVSPSFALLVICANSFLPEVSVKYTSNGKSKCSVSGVSLFARRPKAIGFGATAGVRCGSKGWEWILGERVWFGFGDLGCLCIGCFGKLVCGLTSPYMLDGNSDNGSNRVLPSGVQICTSSESLYICTTNDHPWCFGMLQHLR